MNVEQRQAAADPQTKPLDLRCESAIIYNHHHDLLLLLSPKADTHLPSYGNDVVLPSHVHLTAFSVDQQLRR